MFIQDLKLIKSSESRPRVCSPRTQSREPAHKSEKEKLMWPYTSKFNPHAKNHSHRAADTRRYLEVQTFTPVPYQSHLGVFNFHTARHSPPPPTLWVKLFFDISIMLSKAAVPRSAVLWSSPVREFCVLPPGSRVSRQERGSCCTSHRWACNGRSSNWYQLKLTIISHQTPPWLQTGGLPAGSQNHNWSYFLFFCFLVGYSLFSWVEDEKRWNHELLHMFLLTNKRQLS